MKGGAAGEKRRGCKERRAIEEEGGDNFKDYCFSYGLLFKLWLFI